MDVAPRLQTLSVEEPAKRKVGLVASALPMDRRTLHARAVPAPPAHRPAFLLLDKILGTHFGPCLLPFPPADGGLPGLLNWSASHQATASPLLSPMPD